MSVMQHHLAPGTILHERYRIERALGQGGFGITYKARDESLKIEVCVKELFVGGSSTRGEKNSVISQPLAGIPFSDFKKKFIKEATELARFNHPKIVRVLDVFEDNRTAYFVMEYIEGQTLKDIVQSSGALNRRRAIAVMGQLLDAVEEVHRKGKLHRDIKPDNVLLAENDQLVLIDFGSARNFSEGKTMTQTTLLTPGYAPMEQYKEKATRTQASDIYSLGATMYFLLTGNKPLAAPDRLSEDLPPPHEIDPTIDSQMSSAVMLAMEMKTTDRFEKVSEFRKALALLSAVPTGQAAQDSGTSSTQKERLGGEVTNGPAMPTHAPEPKLKLVWLEFVIWGVILAFLTFYLYRGFLQHHA